MAITNTLGISYKVFFTNYIAFYDELNENTILKLNDASLLDKVTSTKYKTDVYTEVKYSPDGSKIAYVTNIDNKIRVYVHDFEKNETKKLFKHGIKNRSQGINETLPVLEWKNNTDLFIVYRGENEWSFFKDDKLVDISGNSLILRNLTGKGRRQYLRKYDKVQALSFSKDGEQMLLSVVENGQSDILLFMPKIKKILPLTNDIYDDIDPVFLGDGKVVFASNRSLDDEGFNKGTVDEINANFDIFEIDVFKNNDRIIPLTSSLSKELKPQVVDGNVYYLSNQTGINSLYKYNYSDSTSTLIAQYLQNIKHYNINNNNLALITSEGKGSSILKQPLTAEQSIEPVITLRQILMEKRTENFYAQEQDTFSVLPSAKETLTSPQNYPVAFSLHNVHSGIKIDPLLGLGMVLDVTMTDKMENHAISGGIFALSDFSSNILYSEYNYLKKRIDFGLKYERENYQFTNPNSFSFLKFGAQKFRGAATLPFNFANSLRLDLGWVQTRQLTYNLTSLIQEDYVTDFGNIELSYMLDNTTKEGLNMLKGTRMKITIDNMFGLRTSDTSLIRPAQESFINLNFDIRNYTEIFKTVTWANRLSFGRSMGNAPKTYIFGGMDNWFGPRTDLNETPPIRYTADVLYQNFITNVRGFNYNVRNGNNFILLNSEFRLPYKKITSFSTYKSVLVENLQFVVFTDIGTAWTGTNPVSQENSINKTSFGGAGKPYKITTYNYRSPLLMGFGGGVRTVVLGTYLKFDLAWGVEDLKVRGPKGYLTLGYDF